jgi:hypothetical protein
VSNQDIEGDAPAGTAPGAAPGTPEYFEQQLAKERDARAQMRDRLRHTEALAAESHALRSRMAQELERVTAERDRLRSAAAQPSTTPGAAVDTASTAAPPLPTPRMAETPRFGEGPLKPPAPTRRSGPWRALAMLGALAAGVAAFAWYSGSLPGENEAATTSTPQAAAAPAASTAVVATASPATPAASVPPALVAAATPAPAPSPGGAVALPPLTPEQVLAASPTAAGSAVVAVATAAPAGMSGRLRTALDGEGIAAPVDVDAATGHVMVADPAADAASRDRTDMVIRAVYAGASLPEPQIEHRWLSPMRGARASPASTPAQDAAAAYAARHATAARATDQRKKAAAPGVSVADAEELRPVLPAGRVNAGCKAAATGKSTAHRNAEVTACMKHSCCSAGNRQTEECRAWDKAYPFTCSAG